MRTIIANALLLLIAPLVFATTLLVPNQYPTIQAGINASVNGDTVLVSPGQYNEYILFSGREIVVKSASGPEVTTIYWNGSNLTAGGVVSFNNQEGRGAVLEGFTVTADNPLVALPPLIRCWMDSGPIIRNNILITAPGCIHISAGGIMVLHAHPLIEGNVIRNNTSFYPGGITVQMQSDAIIRNNVIENNFAWDDGYGTGYGGGLALSLSHALVEHNLIINNQVGLNYGYGGGIAITDSGAYIIRNNTLSGNSAPNTLEGEHGGGVCIFPSLNGPFSLDFTNNIVVNSVAGDGFANYANSPQVAFRCNDVWNNAPSNYWQISPGPSDLSQDPIFEEEWPVYYWLHNGSPCIDAGSFTTDPDSDGTRTDLGAYYHDQPGVNVALKTAVWPFSIPAHGGSFSSQIYLTNHTTSTRTFDVWIDLLYPDSLTVVPILLRTGLNFTAGQHIIRSLNQVVPMTAPPGAYLYRAHTGIHSAGEVFCEVDMPFSKLGFGIRDAGFSGWSVSGWEDNDLTQAAQDNIHPSVFSLHPCSPNPFNPSSVLSFELRVPSHVSLNVYDTAGRLVATLVDGWRDAGTHEVTFDGSRLASGVYLAKLEAGNLTAVQKLVLMK